MIKILGLISILISFSFPLNLNAVENTDYDIEDSVRTQQKDPQTQKRRRVVEQKMNDSVLNRIKRASKETKHPAEAHLPQADYETKLDHMWNEILEESQNNPFNEPTTPPSSEID